MSHYTATNALPFSTWGKGESELSCYWNVPCRSIWIGQECYKVVYCDGGKPLLNCPEDCLNLTRRRKAVRLLCPLFWWYKESTRPSRSTGCGKSERMGIIKGEFQWKTTFCKQFLEWGKKIRYDFFKGKNPAPRWSRQERVLQITGFFSHQGPVWAKRPLQVRGHGASRRGELRVSIQDGNVLLSGFVFITWCLTSVYNSCLI